MRNLCAFGLFTCLLTGTALADAVENVRDHGALGDGQADDTAAFQAAIAAAAESRLPVHVPFGKYRISAPLKLVGVAVTGPALAAWPADIDTLPTLVPVHRDGPLFELGAGGSLAGLDISYDWADEPTEPAPPAVLISGIGVYIRDCRIRYPWDAILTDGVNNVGRLNIENVFIVSPRNIGVRVSGTWDVPRLHNIEVWNAGPVPRGLNQGIGFHLGKNDLIRMTDCFAFAMQHGFLFEDQIEGSEIEGGTWGVLSGCAADFCGYGLTVRGEHTLSIAGGTFWTHGDGLVVEGDGARMRLTGAEVKANGGSALRISGGDHVVVQGCSLLRTMEGFDAPAVRFDGGRLVLNGNHIEALNSAVVVGPAVRGGVIQGNLIDAGEPAPVELAPEVTGVVVDGNG